MVYYSVETAVGNSESFKCYNAVQWIPKMAKMVSTCALE